MVNQSPEQRARDRIDRQLAQAGWVVQDKDTIDFCAGHGIAVREYQTSEVEAFAKLKRQLAAYRVVFGSRDRRNIGSAGPGSNHERAVGGMV